MQIEKIIEEHKEFCVVCNEWKAGKFTLFNFSKKYIPVCKECMDAKVKNDWREHILNKNSKKVE